MSGNVALASARRRRTRETSLPESQPSSDVPIIPKLKTAEAIYMLDARVRTLEKNNGTVLNTENFISQDDFNDIMSKIGSDMGNITNKLDSLNQLIANTQTTVISQNSQIQSLLNKVKFLETELARSAMNDEGYSNNNVQLVINEDAP